MSDNEDSGAHVPSTYVTSKDASIRISNHPEEKAGVTSIQVVTLNRPASLNTFNQEMFTSLIQFFLRIDRDDRIRCVVVTGAGKAFCGGVDLTMKTSGGGKFKAKELRDPGGTLVLAMFNCSKTIIVAFNGLSMGIGMTFPLAASIRLAASSSKFAFPFSRLGVSMESASSYFLPRMVGYSHATYLLATGSMLRGDSKILDGLFAEILEEPSKVLPRALALAEEISSRVSPVAAHINRQLIWRGGSTAEETHLFDSSLLYDMFESKDHAAAKAAFFSKSIPTFTDTLAVNAPRNYPWWTPIQVESLLPATAPKNKSKL